MACTFHEVDKKFRSNFRGISGHYDSIEVMLSVLRVNNLLRLSVTHRQRVVAYVGMIKVLESIIQARKIENDDERRVMGW